MQELCRGAMFAQMQNEQLFLSARRARKDIAEALTATVQYPLICAASNSLLCVGICPYCHDRRHCSVLGTCIVVREMSV